MRQYASLVIIAYDNFSSAADTPTSGCVAARAAASAMPQESARGCQNESSAAACAESWARLLARTSQPSGRNGSGENTSSGPALNWFVSLTVANGSAAHESAATDAAVELGEAHAPDTSDNTPAVTRALKSCFFTFDYPYSQFLDAYESGPSLLEVALPQSP